MSTSLSSGCAAASVCHETLVDFRLAQAEVLEQLLVNSLAALLRTGLARLQRVALDGTRVRAATGAASFRRQSTLRACRARAVAEVARPRAEFDADRETAAR